MSLTPAGVLMRGALAGLLFGLAVSVVEAWVLGGMLMVQHMPPMTEVLALGLAGQLGLGAVLGVMSAPALWRGVLAHCGVVLGLWVGLAWLVALDRSKVAFWLFPALSGAVLLAAGAWVSRRLGAAWGPRWRGLPAALGAAALGAGLMVPGAMYAPALSAVQVERRAAPAGAPDVVVVVLDTVRADHLGAYGYPLPTSPRFDALVPEGIVFRDATAPSTWSLPSHASLFTGVFPSVHGAHDESRVLRPERPTLAEVLAANGYETRCFTANPHISEGFGLTRGFHSSDEAWRQAGVLRDLLRAFRLMTRLGLDHAGLDKGGGLVVDNFTRWVGERPEGAPPAFVFLNFLEAHFPFHMVPEPHLSRFTQRPRAELLKAGDVAMAELFGNKADAEVVARAAGPVTEMYDAGVAYSDALLGRVVDALRGGGRWDNTLLVVLADHGELLGERERFGHGPSLSQEVLRVPLLLLLPGRQPAGVWVDEPVSTVGVFQSVLDVVGVDGPPTQSDLLRPLTEGRTPGQPALSERYVTELGEPSADALSNPDWRYRTYRSGAWKLVESTGHPPQLYDLNGDPHEQHDVAAQQPEVLARVQQELRDWESTLGLPALDAAVDAAAPALDPAAQERLRALGYVE